MLAIDQYSSKRRIKKMKTKSVKRDVKHKPKRMLKRGSGLSLNKMIDKLPIELHIPGYQVKKLFMCLFP